MKHQNRRAFMGVLGMAMSFMAMNLGLAGQTLGAATVAPLPLPVMNTCRSTEHPILPAKWTATALMHDYSAGCQVK